MAVSPRAATLPGSPRSNQQMDILRGYHIPPAAAAATKSLHSWPTLCDPIDSSPPGSSVPGILQARTLEWAAAPFSNYMPIAVLRTGGWGRRCYNNRRPWSSLEEYWATQAHNTVSPMCSKCRGWRGAKTGQNKYLALSVYKDTQNRGSDRATEHLRGF